MATPLPYGDIFFVNTPATDKLSDRLYQEQRYREITQQQENKALDDSMRKEFANVRSVDTPELIGLYNDYKAGKKREYFDKSLRRNPLEFSRVQQENNAKLQKVYEIINGSGEIKDMSKSLLGEKIKNPDAMADDSGQRLAALNNTPYSQIKNHPQFGDLTNMDLYRDQGPNYDFGEALHKAAGTPKDILGKSVPIDNGFQTQTPVHQFGNSPAQVYDYLVNAMAVNKAGHSASKLWAQLPTDQIESTIEKYKQIPQDKWEKMGIDKPQDLGNFTDNKADNYAKYLAMNYAINANPMLSKYLYKANEKAKMDYKFAQDKVMEGIKFGHQKQLKKGEQEAVDNWIVNYWNQRIGDASADKPKAFTVPDPNHPLTQKTTLGKQLNPDQVMMESLKNSGVYPNEVYALEDNRIMPVFYKYKEDFDPKTGKKIGTSIETDAQGNKVIDEELSRPLKLDQAYLSMGYKGQTKKELGGTMQGTYKGASGSTQVSRKYNIDGKTYTHDQLRKLYSEEKIKEYLDAGIIK